METSRELKRSVNCVIRYEDFILLLKRDETKEIDPGVVNVLGGKLEPDETYPGAALREAREETLDDEGVFIAEDSKYKGNFIFRGGYKADWDAKFYIFDVSTMDLPNGNKVQEGELFWGNKNEINSIEKVIWDLPYVWNEFFDDTLTFHIEVDLEDDMSIKKLHKIVNRDGQFYSEEKLEKIDNNLVQTYWKSVDN